MMHFGTVLYGKVDEVPGLFYVKTQFFHVNFVPVFPVKSFVIRAGSETSEGAFSGHSLGWNLRSILTAYARAVLFLLMTGGLIGAIVTISLCLEGDDCWDYFAASVACLVISAGLLYCSFRWIRPHAARALELAGIVGISLEELAQHCVVKNINLSGTEAETEHVLD